MQYLYKFIVLLTISTLIASCGNDFNVDDYYDLESLPGYVAFDAPGNTTVLNPVATNENAGTVNVFVECPTGTQSSINVTYSLAGNAVYGTDYTIAGAQASGGSITIVPNVNDNQNPDRAAIPVTLLTDNTVDGEKRIVITLVEASNASGPLAVGRGGTDLLRQATIVISDVDM